MLLQYHFLILIRQWLSQYHDINVNTNYATLNNDIVKKSIVTGRNDISILTMHRSITTRNVNLININGVFWQMQTSPFIKTAPGSEWINSFLYGKSEHIQPHGCYSWRLSLIQGLDCSRTKFVGQGLKNFWPWSWDLLTMASRSSGHSLEIFLPWFEIFWPWPQNLPTLASRSGLKIFWHWLHCCGFKYIKIVTMALWC